MGALGVERETKEMVAKNVKGGGDEESSEGRGARGAEECECGKANEPFKNRKNAGFQRSWQNETNQL